VSIALLADAPSRIVTRAGACPGDRLYVTGTLGDAALAVRLLRARRGARAPGALLCRFREPTPRLRAGRLLTELGIVSAMIDVSDGLVQDVGHLCAQSQVGAVIHAAAVPRSPAYRRLAPDATGAPPLALHGGEDYELLCTVPKRNVKRLERHQAQLGCPITCIGEMSATRRLTLVDESGRTGMLESTGYDHFRSSVQRRAQ
jgi:thiamine-monophosphate kinase